MNVFVIVKNRDFLKVNFQKEIITKHNQINLNIKPYNY